MDLQKFIESFGKNKRMADLVEYFDKTDDWISYEKAFNFSLNEAKKRRIVKNVSIHEGRPSNSRRAIMFLIKIGYLIADPKRGLKRNENFIPLSQK